ncbi:hydroxymethylbilane synthase [Devosia nitrariae]|uniref:Porphobilinogen deaminase n=1 Tax=Devosia nitrariae TaxID=2071872 RepID=A0ABQ5W424_9HYPH|nr:hydroxymethylbilane synthase [Devosia nitrariae]GLQ54436.1 porphobilinogen deaminase [Devosia nitrariae]
MQSPAPFARIGTRGSPLALAQAEATRDLLARAHGVDPTAIDIVSFVSTADRLKDRPLAEVGGKGLFTKEIDEALLKGEVDIGVHSAKDMATTLPEGMTLAAFLEREDVRDAFISLTARGIDYLPEGARFGTSSIRRAAQVKRLRPDLMIVPFRGNVETRLQKLADGVADATLLALAGLKRLGEDRRATAILDAESFMPAPAQGAIGLAVRAGDDRATALVAPLNHLPTSRAVTAERAMLAVLDGSCRTPVGALSRMEGEGIVLQGEILSLDGAERFAAEVSGRAEDGERLGAELARQLLRAAGPDFLSRWSLP